MSRICQITGKRIMGGNKVSHSNSKSKRIFAPNLQDRRFYIEEEKKYISLRVSANGLRTISKIGLAEAMRRAKANGHLK